MPTALVTHPDCLNHKTPEGHPEQVARLEYVLAALKGKDMLREEAPLASDELLLRVHPAAHLDAMRKASPETGRALLDADTWMSPGTLNAALRAAGGAARAVDMVMAGSVGNAFVATRPPGHHAEAATPMGFCIFGNVAAAAKHALDHHGLARVAIVDFDVHHGNGTQDLVQNDARILFCSTHQMPLYPGTGDPSETGAHGTVLNVALPDGAGGAVFRQVMEGQILPAVDVFAPEMIFISAGFDAHRADPLAGLNLVEADFAWATQAICDLADRHCGGRVVSCLEGGYDLAALASSAAAHVDILIQCAP
ncbi:histone deacetylase family protein [Roseovarius sp. LXJ103]|uniref:histone deacetylase family protein n=1 Tax=Roseovarius carneus TaxID=2853164 RepID=UPI000D60F09A|nr:histone deacetylase family protein [Roseovarius carneus]MBZ8118137.1 histone deacetylase family protein [Roseovarius carneus]PWE36130.1 acetoin utilization protein [Pelagicola sp. LXJ1103]